MPPARAAQFPTANARQALQSVHSDQRTSWKPGSFATSGSWRATSASARPDGGGGHQLFQQGHAGLPDTLWGRNSGRSEYFSTMEVLSLARLACSMVQIRQWRSPVISSGPRCVSGSWREVREGMDFGLFGGMMVGRSKGGGDGWVDQHFQFDQRCGVFEQVRALRWPKVWCARN